MAESLRSIVRNSFKEKLASGGVASTISIRLFRGVEIAQIAKSCGFDALRIDMQHSPLSLESISQICVAALAAGIAPIVRVPGFGPEYVSRVLDGGAMGVGAPGVTSAEDVRRVVKYCKFPPLGERSTGGGLPQLQYRSFPQDETFEVLNDATTVLITLETLEALESVEEIAAVEGLDVIMVGSNDLCAELGIPGQHGHELVRNAYARVIAACRKHGKYAGVGGLSDRKLIAEYIGMGARVVSTGTELSLLMTAGTERARFVQSLKV